MDHSPGPTKMVTGQRAQPLPHPPVCQTCRVPMQVTSKINYQRGPRLTYDATCPECGALLKGFA